MSDEVNAVDGLGRAIREQVRVTVTAILQRGGQLVLILAVCAAVARRVSYGGCAKRNIVMLLLLTATGLSVQSQTTVTSPSPQSVAGTAVRPASGLDRTIIDYSPPPDAYARAKAHANAYYRHFFVNTVYGLLVLFGLLHWQVAVWFRNLAERITGHRLVQLFIFSPLILLTIGVLGIPSDIWDHSNDLSFGRSLQTWPSWLSDWIINETVILLIGTALIGILYAVIRVSPQRWWLYFWLASFPVLLIAFFLKPLAIDPLFYRFEPLAVTQPGLVSEIQKITLRAGIKIPSDHLFLRITSSKQSGMGGAYVTGFGATQRVVISDSTISKGPLPETLFVFGHEMGHYVLRHVPKEIAAIATIILVVLYVGYRLSLWMLARWGMRWGFRRLDDWASFPMLFLVMNLLVFLVMPAVNAVSRYFEHEADRFGIEVIHGSVANPGQAAAHHFERDGELNLSDPDPNWLMKFWFWDHPTYPERVRFAASCDPWSHGNEPKYVK